MEIRHGILTIVSRTMQNRIGKYFISIQIHKSMRHTRTYIYIRAQKKKAQTHTHTYLQKRIIKFFSTTTQEHTETHGHVNLDMKVE